MTNRVTALLPIIFTYYTVVFIPFYLVSGGCQPTRGKKQKDAFQQAPFVAKT